MKANLRKIFRSLNGRNIGQFLSKTVVGDIFVQNKNYEPTITDKNSWLENISFFKGYRSEFYMRP